MPKTNLESIKKETPFNRNNKKVILEGKIIEGYKSLLSGNCRCGATFTKNVTYKVGMERKESRQLERTLSYSLGKEDIASVKDEIKSISGWETTNMYERETSFDASIPSPECGEKNIKLYQSFMRLKLSVRKKRGKFFSSILSVAALFQNDKPQDEFTEYLDEYTDLSESYGPIKECGCNLPQPAPPYKPSKALKGKKTGYTKMLHTGKVRKALEMIEDNSGVKIPELDLFFPNTSINALLNKEVYVKTVKLPASMLIFEKKPLAVETKVKFSTPTASELNLIEKLKDENGPAPFLSINPLGLLPLFVGISAGLLVYLLINKGSFINKDRERGSSVEKGDQSKVFSPTSSNNETLNN